jgi:hypothetical protein
LLGNKELSEYKIFGFALSPNKQADNIIDIGFYSGQVNRDGKVGLNPPIEGLSHREDAMGCILNRTYQKKLMDYLEGSGLFKNKTIKLNGDSPNILW